MENTRLEIIKKIQTLPEVFQSHQTAFCHL